MKPELAQFESKNPKVKLVEINVDEEDSADYKKYSELKTSGYIPETLLLDRKGKVINQFVGFKSAQELEAAVKGR